MKEMYDDYVQPPSYKDSEGSDDSLIKKLQLRIQQDLNQINGVYDSQIAEAEENKKKNVMKIESAYNDAVELINKQRKNDIFIYNEKAEKHIDNLISTIHNSQKSVESWWSRIFG